VPRGKPLRDNGFANGKRRPPGTRGGRGPGAGRPGPRSPYDRRGDGRTANGQRRFDLRGRRVSHSTRIGVATKIDE
jgi:hypothetical protein